MPKPHLVENAVVEPESLPQVAPAAEKETAAAGENPTPAAAEEEEKQTSLQTDETHEPIQPSPSNPARPEARGKRWAKAVGRFLHIGPRKDSNAQAIRQP